MRDDLDFVRSGTAAGPTVAAETGQGKAVLRRADREVKCFSKDQSGF